MMMASFFLLFRERKKKFLFVNDGKRKRAQGNARNLSASAAFWASGGFWANLFFLPFRFKKSSPFLWWEIAQSQTDTRAPSFRLFRTKNSLFISIHKFYIALVEHT